MSGRKPSLPFSVPNFAEVSPEYADLIARRGKLGARKDEIRTKLLALYEQLRGLGGRTQPATVSPEAAAKKARVAKLLGQEVAPPPSPEPLEDYSSEIDGLEQERSDVDAALVEIERQLKAMRRVASRSICSQVLPAFDAMTERVIAAGVKFYEEAGAYTAFADHMMYNDVSWAELNPLSLRPAERLSSANGDLADMLREAADIGRIRRDRLPTSLR